MLIKFKNLMNEQMFKFNGKERNYWASTTHRAASDPSFILILISIVNLIRSSQ